MELLGQKLMIYQQQENLIILWMQSGAAHASSYALQEEITGTSKQSITEEFTVP